MFTRLQFSVVMTTLLLLGAFSQAQTASAQGIKVGYTDHEILLLYMPEYQEAQRFLQGQFQASEQALTELTQEFQAAVQRYQTQQSLLNETARASREQELAQQQQDIQASVAQKEQELAELELERIGPIVEKVETAINAVANELQLDIVLKATVGGQPLLLFVNQETVVDITPQVAARLGIEVSESPEAGAGVPSSN